jgi:hypothetical protein
MAGIGRLLILIGGVVLALGLLLTIAPRIPFLSQLGRLPGDIRVERPGFSFHFPLTSAILVSIVLTVLLRLLLRR